MSKGSWRSLLMGCCGRPKKHVAKQISLQRLWSNSTGLLSPDDLSMSLVGSNLFVFTHAELKAATQSFSISNFLGEGGFGPVYKGFIDDELRPGLEAQPIAVKLLDLEGLQGHREWQAEVIFLGQLRHPHLVKLIGYCYEDEHRLLVYEFMARGSLENHLFKRFYASLPWLTRLKIVVGAAKGLAFLHGTDKPVIYRDFKASNILLDSDYKAKLSDFGLAKDGPEGDDTHVSTQVMGTQGYAAPEYIMTGHLTAKSDVYSYGVVLLELLTGRRSVDMTRPSREQNLVEWARPCLTDARKLTRIMDPTLDGQYSTDGALKASTLSYKCLSHNPKSRPHMSDVVETLEPLLVMEDLSVLRPLVYTLVPENGDQHEETKIEAKENGSYRHKRRHSERLRLVNSASFSNTTLTKVSGNVMYRNPPKKSQGNQGMNGNEEKFDVS